MTTPSLSAFSVGSVIAGTYQITRLIGQGGMGAVWEANHLRLPGKRVALKVLLAGADDPQMLARFRREAEIASRLGHPNIVQILDFNTLSDGVPYIVLELLSGENLSARLSRGPVPLGQAQAIVRQIGSALQAAHREGIIHRDLKPENIFLCPSEIGGELREIAKVLDFGISKMRNASTALTQGAAIMGTPRYMAPEQAMGHNDDIDARTDIFSFGAVVYEMLGGRPAFGGDSLAAVVHAVVYAPTPPLGSIAPAVPPAIAAAVDRALAKSAADRFPDVASFVSAVTGRSLETLAARPEISGTDGTQILSSAAPASYAPASSTLAGAATQAALPSSASIPPTVPESARREAAPPRRRSPLIIVLAVGAGLAAAGGVVVPRLLSPGSTQPGASQGDMRKVAGSKVAQPVELGGAAGPAGPDITGSTRGASAADSPADPATEHGPPSQPRGKGAPAKPERADKEASLAPAAAAELNEAEGALSAGKASDAIRLAQHSLYTQKSSRAYALIARAHCVQGDLGNAKAAFAKVLPRERPAVLRACHAQSLDLK